MDGRLAALFWLMSVPSGDFTQEHFAVVRADPGPRLAVSAGQIYFQDERSGWETRATYIFGDQYFGRFSPLVDISVTDAGGTFVGVGLYQQMDFSLGDLDMFTGFSFTPGLYMRGNEVDLGYPLEFRSGAEIGVRLAQGWQASVLYDHRSNAGLGDINPGLETIQLKISKPISW